MFSGAMANRELTAAIEWIGPWLRVFWPASLSIRSMQAPASETTTRSGNSRRSSWVPRICTLPWGSLTRRRGHTIWRRSRSQSVGLRTTQLCGEKTGSSLVRARSSRFGRRSPWLRRVRCRERCWGQRKIFGVRSKGPGVKLYDSTALWITVGSRNDEVVWTISSLERSFHVE